MVFVNYGRIEDFLYLKKIGVQLTGKICIAKYGKIFRGDKVNILISGIYNIKIY